MPADPPTATRVRIARGEIRDLGPLVAFLLASVGAVFALGFALVAYYGKGFIFALPCGLVALVGAVLVYANLPAYVHVGADGLRVDWRGSEQYISFADLTGASVYREGSMGKTLIGVTLALREAEAVRLPIGEDQFGADKRAASLAAQISTALAAYDARDPGDPSAMLARGGQAPAVWLRRLRAMGTGASDGPREAALSTDGLWRLVENPAASPELRASAAVALAPRLDEGGKTRLRGAASSTASPRLRVVLERAGDAEEDALAEALAGVEEATGPPIKSR